MTDITWTSEERMLGDLREWDRNPRQLSKHDADMIAVSIGKFNLADPLVINADGQIIGGHQRKRVMLDNGYKVNDFIDVRVPSRQLTEKEAEELNIRLNRNSGEWDFDVLANEFELGELLEWGFTEYDFQLAGVEWGEDELPEDPGPQVDRAEELQEKWQVQRGQVWEIGRHRLMCGDSTDAGDVGRLMGEKRADCAFSDPPFAIYGSSTGVSQSVADSAMVRPFFRDAARAFRQATREFAHVYVCCDWRSFCVLTDAAAGSLVLKNMIVWVKPGGNVSGTFYTNVHELVALFVNEPPATSMFKKKTGHRAVYDQNVWEQAVVPVTHRGHFAEKPLENITRAITNSTDDGNLVADLFIGAGTTFVACEQTGRIGYGMEIEPKYCAVTLERLAGMGLEAKLLDG